jgi:hypothetical protein
MLEVALIKKVKSQFSLFQTMEKPPIGSAYCASLAEGA